MNRGTTIENSFHVMMLVAVAMLGSPSLGQEPKSEDIFFRQYRIDATLYSLVPGDELATYRSYLGGHLGPGETLVLGIEEKERQFKVFIDAAFKAGRFSANITLKPSDKDILTRAQEVAYDLSDLNPHLLELVRDNNGRVYRLSLVPRILESPKPKQFSAAGLLLENWSFPSSPVIANDQDYVGRLSMSGGPIAWCDIPGFAKIEFSLLHLKDAEALGTLSGGVINIAHKDGRTLRISDVKNGAGEALAGGPFRVWVRWMMPTRSVENYRESIKQRVASLKERVKDGDLLLPPGTLERLEQQSELGRIGEITSGLRGIEADEVVK